MSNFERNIDKGDIEAAKKTYEIDYCASSFEELYEVLENWAPKA